MNPDPVAEVAAKVLDRIDDEIPWNHPRSSLFEDLWLHCPKPKAEEVVLLLQEALNLKP